jgi:hypothetical protein
MCVDVGNNADASRFLVKYRRQRVTPITHQSLGLLIRVQIPESPHGIAQERFGG